MKLKRLVVLTLILVMTTSFTVFAEDTEQVTTTDITVTTETTTEPTEEETVQNKVTLDTPTVWDSTNYLEQKNKAKTSLKVGESDSYFIVKADHDGYLCFTITSDSSNKNEVKVQQRKNSNNKKVRDVIKEFKPGSTQTVMVKVAKNKEYRFTMKYAAVGDQFSAKGFVVIGDKTRTLFEPTDSSYRIASGERYSSSSNNTYWKVKVENKGIMRVKVSDIWNSTPKYVKVTLLNKKKKEISAKVKVTGTENGDYIDFGEVTYGVTAGTYYVKVTADVPVYGITMTTDSSYKDSGYTSKKKASVLQSGLDCKTVLNASRSSLSHYYKFTLADKGTVPATVRVIASADTTVKVQLVKSNGTVIGTGKIEGKSPAVRNTIAPVNWKDKDTGGQLELSAGTYYIKISKDSKKTSAAYEIFYTE